MIHVATVHFASARWIDPQLAYLRRHLHEPYRVWANLEQVPGDHDHKVDVVVPAAGPHAGKLNLLAAEIGAVAGPDDLIMFLDGDAFPVDDPMPVVRAGLADGALVAIRRDENGHDPQPHPSFCVVSVASWEALGGDWSPGHCWPGDREEPVTDVGGNLLAALERTKTRWTPLLRSNRVNPHPLWFGVYGRIVYHHGAGFRDAVGRADMTGRPRPLAGGSLPVVGAAVRRADASRWYRWRARTVAAGRALDDDVYGRLVSDPEFYRALL